MFSQKSKIFKQKAFQIEKFNGITAFDKVCHISILNNDDNPVCSKYYTGHGALIIQIQFLLLNSVSIIIYVEY